MAHPLSSEQTAKWYVNLFKQILATGKIKPVPVFMQPNGLAGVKDGLQHMQDEKVSPTHVLRMDKVDADRKLAG
jgi:hypothetical protein